MAEQDSVRFVCNRGSKRIRWKWGRGLFLKLCLHSQLMALLSTLIWVGWRGWWRSGVFSLSIASCSLGCHCFSDSKIHCLSIDIFAAGDPRKEILKTNVQLVDCWSTDVLIQSCIRCLFFWFILYHSPPIHLGDPTTRWEFFQSFQGPAFSLLGLSLYMIFPVPGTFPSSLLLSPLPTPTHLLANS